MFFKKDSHKIFFSYESEQIFIDKKEILKSIKNEIDTKIVGFLLDESQRYKNIQIINQKDFIFDFEYKKNKIYFNLILKLSLNSKSDEIDLLLANFKRDFSIEYYGVKFNLRNSGVEYDNPFKNYILDLKRKH